MMKKETILKIPKLREQGLTNPEIAVKLGMNLRTLAYWIKRLKEAGHTFPATKPKGRTKLNLAP